MIERSTLPFPCVRNGVPKMEQIPQVGRFGGEIQKKNCLFQWMDGLMDDQDG